MSYENAPATQLLATVCACCARPLVDAKSVETGMGPVCRSKHGFNKPDHTDVDWTGFALALSAVPDSFMATLSDSDPRSNANRIVYRIAALHSVETTASREEIARLLNSLHFLGFVKLSAVLKSRLISIHVVRTDAGFQVTAPYDERFNDEIRRVQGRRWVKNESGKGGHNFVPAGSATALHNALCAAFPGMVAMGSKGPFVLVPRGA